jgi:hypothetical protein
MLKTLHHTSRLNMLMKFISSGVGISCCSGVGWVIASQLPSNVAVDHGSSSQAGGRRTLSAEAEDESQDQIQGQAGIRKRGFAQQVVVERLASAFDPVLDDPISERADGAGKEAVGVGEDRGVEDGEGNPEDQGGLPPFFGIPDRPDRDGKDEGQQNEEGANDQDGTPVAGERGDFRCSGGDRD